MVHPFPQAPLREGGCRTNVRQGGASANRPLRSARLTQTPSPPLFSYINKKEPRRALFYFAKAGERPLIRQRKGEIAALRLQEGGRSFPPPSRCGKKSGLVDQHIPKVDRVRVHIERAHHCVLSKEDQIHFRCFVFHFGYPPLISWRCKQQLPCRACIRP